MDWDAFVQMKIKKISNLNPPMLMLKNPTLGLKIILNFLQLVLESPAYLEEDPAEIWSVHSITLKIARKIAQKWMVLAFLNASKKIATLAPFANVHPKRSRVVRKSARIKIARRMLFVLKVVSIPLVN